MKCVFDRLKIHRDQGEGTETTECFLSTLRKYNLKQDHKCYSLV